MPKKLVIAAVLVVAALCAPVAAVAVRNDRLGDALVADVQSLSARRTRPVHRGPALDGGFEECIAPLVDAAVDGGSVHLPLQSFSYGAPEEVRAQVAAVLDGGVAFAALAEATRGNLDAVELWANRLSECSRAGVLSPVEGLGPFVNWSHPRDNFPMFAQAAGKVTMLSVRRDLEAGRAGGTQRCVDLLAFVRDVQLVKGLIGAMVAVSMTKTSLTSCVAALGLASPDELRAFKAQLALVRAGLPTFKNVLQVERAQMQLMAFGSFLSEPQLRALSPMVRVDSASAVVSSTRTQTIARWLYWGSYLQELDALIAASEGPNRDAAFAAIEADPSILEPFVTDVPSMTNWTKFARRHDGVGRGFDLLESAARVGLKEPPLPSVTAKPSGASTVLSIEWFEKETLTVTVPDPPR